MKGNHTHRLFYASIKTKEAKKAVKLHW